MTDDFYLCVRLFRKIRRLYGLRRLFLHAFYAYRLLINIVTRGFAVDLDIGLRKQTAKKKKGDKVERRSCSDRRLF
jgi:hypothetical protein